MQSVNYMMDLASYKEEYFCLRGIVVNTKERSIYIVLIIKMLKSKS